MRSSSTVSSSQKPGRLGASGGRGVRLLANRQCVKGVEPMATTDQTIATRNKACVSRHFEEIWNQGALDAIGNYYAADFSNFGMLMNVDRVRQIVQAWRTAFPDLHYTVDALLAEDDRVVGHCTLSGTQHRPLPLRAWAM